MNLGVLAERIDAAREPQDEWCSVEKAHALAAIVAANRPELVVEIGVWRGASLIPQLVALQLVGSGRAIAIDPWDPVASIAGEEPANVEWWGSQVGPQGHEDAYRAFMRRVTRIEAQGICDVWRQPSDAVDPPQGIGLLHIDGNHTDQAIRDVTRFAPNVLSGGMLVLDDIHWSSGSVGRAQNVAKHLGFVDRYLIGQPATCLVMQRRLAI